MQGPGTDAADAAGPASFVGRLERYDDRPDRLTIHPADADDVDKMAMWLTADAAAFVDLEENE